MRTVRLTKESTKDILENLLKRSPNNYGKFEATVVDILANVKEKGDEALFSYTKEFDKVEVTPETIRVTEEEIEDAYKAVDASLLEVIRKALVNIRSYHEKQRQNSWFTSTENGTMLGQKVTPLNRVGVYVPGGKAVYPSSVLMNIVPAKVAGVPHIVMTTPPGKDGMVNPSTLVAAKEAGADEIYKVGGAQAIGALAYGTASIPKVDKIVGPGNIFVALAKKAVYGHVSIDSIAGPSEILVLADETANAHYVAADLLSQAEHDEMASAILITTSTELAQNVEKEIEGYLKVLSRKEIIEKSLENFGYILIAEDMDEAIEAANEIASEHMEIVTKNAFETQVRSLLANTAPSLLETILQGRTMFFQPTELLNFSLHFPLTTLSRNPASCIIPNLPFGISTRILSSLQHLNSLRHTPIPLQSVLRTRIKRSSHDKRSYC